MARGFVRQMCPAWPAEELWRGALWDKCVLHGLQKTVWGYGRLHVEAAIESESTAGKEVWEQHEWEGAGVGAAWVEMSRCGSEKGGKEQVWARRCCLEQHACTPPISRACCFKQRTHE
eukprot:364358-Chlamydomonas_euryale.AAC.24